MAFKLDIRIYDKSQQLWLGEGGTFTPSKPQSKSFDSILKATDTARRSGIKDDDVEPDWGLKQCD